MSIKSILAVGLPGGGLRINWYELEMTDKNILVIGFGGGPCSGKTTLMREFMKRLSPSIEFARLAARGHQPIKGHYDPYNRVFIMGDYRDAEVGLFGGTDKLSMSVQPHAVAMLRHAATGGHALVGTVSTPRAIVFEGDRLFNGSFIGEVRKLPSTASRFIVLHASAETKQTRRGMRGDKQSAEWLRGRESKYGNILNLVAGVEQEAHETEADTQRLADWLFREVTR